MEINHLGSDELRYELSIRGLPTTGSMSDKRMMLRGAMRHERSGQNLEPTTSCFDVESDLCICQAKLITLHRDITNIDTANKDNECRRIHTFLIHVELRLNRCHCVNQSEQDLKEQLLAKCRNLFDSLRAVADGRSTGSLAATQIIEREIAPEDGSILDTDNPPILPAAIHPSINVQEGTPVVFDLIDVDVNAEIEEIANIEGRTNIEEITAPSRRSTVSFADPEAIISVSHHDVPSSDQEQSKRLAMPSDSSRQTISPQRNMPRRIPVSDNIHTEIFSSTVVREQPVQNTRRLIHPPSQMFDNSNLSSFNRSTRSNIVGETFTQTSVRSIPNVEDANNLTRQPTFRRHPIDLPPHIQDRNIPASNTHTGPRLMSRQESSENFQSRDYPHVFSERASDLTYPVTQAQSSCAPLEDQYPLQEYPSTFARSTRPTYLSSTHEMSNPNRKTNSSCHTSRPENDCPPISTIRRDSQVRYQNDILNRARLAQNNSTFYNESLSHPSNELTERFGNLRFSPETRPIHPQFYVPSSRFQDVSSWNVKYNGQSSVTDFIERIEELRISRGVPKEQLLRSAPEIFTKDALLWFRTKQFHSWDDLITQLKEAFQPYDYEFALMDEIHKRTQGSGERVVSFVVAMEGLFRKLPILPPEDRRLQVIRRNLLPHIQRRLATEHIASLEDLLRLSRAIEETETRIQRFAPPPTNYRHLLESALAYQKPTPHIMAIDNTLPDDEEDQNTNESPYDLDAVNIPRPQICWNCRESGHQFRNCDKPRKRFCYKCGQEDVISKNCLKCAKNDSTGR